ncbi:hypothetical protein GCM10027589_06270 [Actinocorallia lasiicapitis]
MNKPHQVVHHQPQPSADKPAVWTHLWALAPLFSLGLLAPPVIGYAAVRLRSPKEGIATLVYLVGVVLVATTDEGASTLLDAITAAGLFAAWFGATAHAYAIRRKVFAPRTPTAPPSVNDQVLQDVAARRELRAQARHILATDPALANELRIGRPDLSRSYNDGGLVDVNHAPLHALVSIPCITPEIGAAIVAARTQHGPFHSAEDLAATTNLNPYLVPQLAEYTYYVDRTTGLPLPS